MVLHGCIGLANKLIGGEHVRILPQGFLGGRSMLWCPASLSMLVLRLKFNTSYQKVFEKYHSRSVMKVTDPITGLCLL
jgi:hypothetical protein